MDAARAGRRAYRIDRMSLRMTLPDVGFRPRSRAPPLDPPKDTIEENAGSDSNHGSQLTIPSDQSTSCPGESHCYSASRNAP
jgi:hypothetical protein